jgi:broad specificity phosphatase PhoE
MRQALVGRSGSAALTLHGREQVKATAEYLARFHVDRLVSSPQPRALETARILTGILTVPAETHAGFDELDFGRWSGMAFGDLNQLPEWQTFNLCRSLMAAPEGESLREAQTRALTAILELHATSLGKTFAVVTHADIIRSVFAFFSGSPLDLFLRFSIAPASVSILTVSDSFAQIECLNRTA